MASEMTSMNKYFFAAIIAAVFNLSCNKIKQPVANSLFSSKQNERSVGSGIQIKNGIMFFNSIDVLDLKIQELHALSEEQLDHYNKSYQDFTSLYRQYQMMDELANVGNGLSADSAIRSNLIVDIPDLVFASVVSKRGLLVVGDSIYYYSDGGFQVANYADYENTANFNWSTIAKKGFGQINYGNPEWASFPPCSHFFDTYDNTNSWPKHNGRTVRAVHTTWCSWFGVYSSAGTKIKLEKKSKYAGWINIEHESANNITSSNFRYYTLYSSGAGSWWAWDYYNKADSKSTSGKNVNEIILTYKVSLVAGPLQHQVNSFMNTVSITRHGCTLSTSWTH